VGLEPPHEPPDALLRGLSLGLPNLALPDVAEARSCGPAKVLLRPPAEPWPARERCCLLVDEEPGVWPLPEERPERPERAEVAVLTDATVSE
jgi:hypothetical protein